MKPRQARALAGLSSPIPKRVPLPLEPRRRHMLEVERWQLGQTGRVKSEKERDSSRVVRILSPEESFHDMWRIVGAATLQRVCEHSERFEHNEFEHFDLGSKLSDEHLECKTCTFDTRNLQRGPEAHPRTHVRFQLQALDPNNWTRWAGYYQQPYVEVRSHLRNTKHIEAMVLRNGEAYVRHWGFNKEHNLFDHNLDTNDITCTTCGASML